MLFQILKKPPYRPVGQSRSTGDGLTLSISRCLKLSGFPKNTST